MWCILRSTSNASFSIMAGGRGDWAGAVQPPSLGQQAAPRTADSLTISMASTISFGDANFGFQAGIINGPVNAEFHLPPGKLSRIKS